MERRRDNKGRILHDGEMQMKDGRYRFKYTSWDGKSKVVYSWRLNHNDRAPVGKKRTESLREMEALCTHYIGITISSISEKSTTKYIRSRCHLFHHTFADTHIVVRWLDQV